MARTLGGATGDIYGAVVKLVELAATRRSSRCGPDRNASMTVLPHRPLGASGLEVSPFALGSWRTYERIPREPGVAVLEQARERGIDFLEVARYNDESGARRSPPATPRWCSARSSAARAGRATR